MILCLLNQYEMHNVHIGIIVMTSNSFEISSITLYLSSILKV